MFSGPPCCYNHRRKPPLTAATAASHIAVAAGTVSALSWTTPAPTCELHADPAGRGACSARLLLLLIFPPSSPSLYSFPCSAAASYVHLLQPPRSTRKPHPVASRATVQKAAASGCGACTYASRADSAGTARERVLVLLAVVGRQSRRHRRRLSPCHASRACRGFVAWLVLRAFSSTHIDDDSRVVLALRSSGARGVLPFSRRASRGGAASSVGD